MEEKQIMEKEDGGRSMMRGWRSRSWGEEGGGVAEDVGDGGGGGERGRMRG